MLSIKQGNISLTRILFLVKWHKNINVDKIFPYLVSCSRV